MKIYIISSALRLSVFARKTDFGFYPLVDINLMPFANPWQQISPRGIIIDWMKNTFRSSR